MGVIQANMDLQAGNGVLRVAHSSLPNTTAHVAEINSIGASYDLEEETNNAKSVFFAPTELKATFFDELGDGSSFFTLIDAIDSNSNIAVELDFATDGGHTWNDEFTLHSSDIKMNREDRTTEIKATFLVRNPAITIKDIFDLYQVSDVETIHRSPTQTTGEYTGECMTAHDFINNFLKETFTGKTIINNSNTFDNVLTSESIWCVLAEHNIPPNPSGSYPVGQETSAETMLYRLATLSGDFVGCLMGYVFVEGRISTNNAVTITPSQVVDYEIKPSEEAYIYVLCCADWLDVPFPSLNDWEAAGVQYGSADGLSDRGKKVLEVYFKMGGLSLARWDETDDVFYSIDNASPDYTWEAFATINNQDGASEGTYGFVIDQIADPEFGIPPGTILVLGYPGDLRLDTGSNTAYYVGGYDEFAVCAGYNMETNMLYTAAPLKNTYPDGATVNIFNPYGDMCAYGARSYAKAYGADGSRRIEITILDIDTLTPYEPFTLSGGFKFGLDGQTFRPSEIKYNLQTDQIKIKAYQIG